MTNNPDTNQDWVNFFKDRGLEPSLIDEYVTYSKNLTTNNLPVIFEIEHLSHLVGIKYTEFVKMANAPESFYREFKLKKRRGGFRTISTPYPSLLQCQTWIYKNILLNIPVHQCAHGFVPKKSIISNASVHIGSDCILKMDLANFFPSIPISWVIELLQNLGYRKKLSYFIAMLCCNNEKLPQGAPTSPYLSNILLKGLDKKLFKIAKNNNLKYTRYADDITFSGSYINRYFSQFIKNIIEEYGLEVNLNKTLFIPKNRKKIVTGIVVNKDSISIPREEKRELKKILHYINRYGYYSHISKIKNRNPLYIYELLGKLAFWRQVEPSNEFVSSNFEKIKKISNSY